VVHILWSSFSSEDGQEGTSGRNMYGKCEVLMHGGRIPVWPRNHSWNAISSFTHIFHAHRCSDEFLLIGRKEIVAGMATVVAPRPNHHYHYAGVDDIKRGSEWGWKIMAWKLTRKTGRHGNGGGKGGKLWTCIVLYVVVEVNTSYPAQKTHEGDENKHSSIIPSSPAWQG